MNLKIEFNVKGKFIRNRRFLIMELNLTHNPNRKVIQHSLPSGAYFIGDIFYGLDHKYTDIVYDNIEERVLTLEKDEVDDSQGSLQPLAKVEYTLVFDKVFGGKNSYTDSFEHEYEVESEYFGIVPFELCDFSDDLMEEKENTESSKISHKKVDKINEIGQYIEFDSMVDVYIVDGIFMFHWAPTEDGDNGGFLKIDTKNAQVEEIEDYEYNDMSYEEYMFEQVNQTKEDEEVKEYKSVENVEDFDDVEKTFVDNESNPIDPNLLQLTYLDTLRK